jgi:hypothetical protein
MDVSHPWLQVAAVLDALLAESPLTAAQALLLLE